MKTETSIGWIPRAVAQEVASISTPTDPADCLSFQGSGSGNGGQEVIALLDSGDSQPRTVRIGIKAATSRHARMLNAITRYIAFDGSVPRRVDAPRLGSAIESPWTFIAGYWPIQGLTGDNSKTGQHFQIALETPYLAWGVRHAVQLPDHQVLFQLGTRQVCILDAETMKIAVLGVGRGAIAVLESSSLEHQDHPSSDR